MTLAPWIKTLLGLDMKTGDPIYYKDKNGDTFPGVVVDIKQKVKIKINHFCGDKKIWVKKHKVELQSDNN